MLGGFITFPLLTKTLSVADYGILSLLQTTITVFVGIGKLGMQHAIVNFYHSEASDLGKQRLVSTLLLGSIACGSCFAIFFLGLTTSINISWIPSLMVSMLIALLIFAQVFKSSGAALLRVKELSTQLASTQVLEKYLIVMMLVVVLYFYGLSVPIFFVITLLATIWSTVWFWRYALKGHENFNLSFSRRRWRALVAFGIPMVGFELASIAVNQGDRFLIFYLIGSEAVGEYAAYYNVCQYVNQVLVASVASAALPTYLRIWKEEGRDSTLAFLNKSLEIYLVLSIPVAIGFSIVGGSFISLLAGSNYANAGSVIPFVITGMTINGTVILIAAGLYVEKRSKELMGLLVITALINFGANLVLIPKFGIMGAGLATLLSFVALACFSYFKSMHILRVTASLKVISTSALASALMGFGISFWSLEGEWADLAAKSLVGAILFAVIFLSIDNSSRHLVRKMLAAKFGADGRSDK